MIGFTFKNISSDSMGVVLAELPPITKPPKIYREYQVIGKDGTDIIEDGYSSYEKSLHVGIKDASRINDIMAWLSGRGTLIISNEPDKYYLARVLSQIDYTSLVRFREAIITFKVQPYKYAVDNDVIEITESPYMIINNGNESCRPTLTIYGSGNVSILLDGVTIFTLSSIPSAITVNGMAHECFYGNTSYNRKKTGDFLVVPTGEHIISWTGSVTKVEMVVNKRWL